MSSKWHRLHLIQQELPPLLFQYTWTRRGYVLYVTDLTSVWAEELSKSQILKRADDLAATIDPSEDLQQLDLLLAKLGEALRGDGGTASIHTGIHAESIKIVTTSKLPAPLRPLKWTLHISKKPPSSLTEQILLPLLKGEASWESRQRFLLDQLKQKDWALGKLLDKLEAIGLDLSTVFPSASRRRNAQNSITREELAKSVHGIAPFDQSSWLAESRELYSGSPGLVSDVFQATVGSSSPESVEKLGPPQDGWWHSLQPFDDMASPIDDQCGQISKEDLPIKSTAESAQVSQGDVDLDMSTASEDDEFERQETPSHLKTHQTVPEVTSKSRDKTPSPMKKGNAAPRSPRPPVEDAGESTASESDLDLEPPLAKSPPKPRKTLPKSPSPNLSSQGAGDSTASESEQEPPPELKNPEPRKRIPTDSPPSPRKPSTPQPQQTGPRKPKGTLGTIGGKKKKEEAPPLSPQREPSPDATIPASSPAKAKQPMKLGMIGGKTKSRAPVRNEVPVASIEESSSSARRNEPPNSADVDQKEMHATTAKLKEEKPTTLEEEDPDTAAVSETEDQKADRKREELKRQLAEKSKAPKKKRKF